MAETYEERHFQDVADVGVAWDANTKRVWVCLNGAALLRTKMLAGLMMVEFINPEADSDPWVKVESWEEIYGKDCLILLERRPHYCDRGNFIAKIFPSESLSGTKLGIDDADGWPRYYFDENRAKAEIKAWLMKRNQWKDE